MPLPWRASSMSWSGDDPDPVGRAGVAGDRAHGSAQRVCEPVAAGSGGASAQSLERPPVLLSRPSLSRASAVLRRISERDRGAKIDFATFHPQPFPLAALGLRAGVV